MQGRCPNCYSDNLDYGVSLLEGDSLGYSCTCSECNTKFIEWYNLEYLESIIKQQGGCDE